jgi:hypothetical protein
MYRVWLAELTPGNNQKINNDLRLTFNVFERNKLIEITFVAILAMYYVH